MKNFTYFLFFLVSISSFAEEKICHYAGAFDSVRLKVDYDPIFGASDLCLQTIFQSEGGENLGVFDDRPRLYECIDIDDSKLNKFVDIENKTLYPFEKGSGKIKISPWVDEKDYPFPRFWNHPMKHSYLFDSSRLGWKPLSAADVNASEFDEFVVVTTSNNKVDLKLKLYRFCAQ